MLQKSFVYNFIVYQNNKVSYTIFFTEKKNSVENVESENTLYRTLLCNIKSVKKIIQLVTHQKQAKKL